MVALRLVRAALMAAAGAVVALAQLNLPSRSFWDDHVLLQWLSVLIIAFFVVYEAIRSINYAVQASRIRAYDNDLRSVLSAGVAEVVSLTGAPWDEVGMQYYYHAGPPFRKRLVLTGTVKAGSAIADAQPDIRPGVGIIGTAFASQVIIAEEWRKFVRTATGRGPQAWKELSAAARYGLTWGQLRRSAQPDGVVASPTFDADGRPDGCIVLSGPLKLRDMTSDAARRTLDDVATSLDLLGSPPRGWRDLHER